VDATPRKIHGYRKSISARAAGGDGAPYAAQRAEIVRAMLGALGEMLRRSNGELKSLGESLNPYSRFDFGIFAGIQIAKNWQAKMRR